VPWTEFILPAASAALSAGVLVILWRERVIGPGSLPARSLRDVSGIGPVIWLLCAMLVYLSMAEGSIIASRLPRSVVGPPETVQWKAMTLAVAYVVSLAAGGLVVWLVRAHAGEKAGLNIWWGDVPRGVIAIALAAPVCFLVGWASQFVAGLIGGKPPDALAHETLKLIMDPKSAGWSWLLGACAVLGAPVIEEIIYRALLQSFLLSVLGRGRGGRGERGRGRDAGSGAWAAIIGTAALFAAMHVSMVPPHALPTLFVLGVAMGLAFERTRRLGVPITMHVLFNAGNIAAAVVLRPEAQ